MNGTNGNGSKAVNIFWQILAALIISGIIGTVASVITVGVLGERMNNMQVTLTRLDGSTTDIRDNYVRRTEVDPRFTRIENQVDAIYRDMARLEKKQDE